MDSLYLSSDSTTIRLRYDDTTTHSTTTEVMEVTIRLRYDYDKNTTRLRRKNDVIFLLASNGNRRAQTSYSDRSRIVAYITIAIDYDKTTIRRIQRYHDAFDYDESDRNYDSLDCDTTRKWAWSLDVKATRDNY